MKSIGDPRALRRARKRNRWFYFTDRDRQGNVVKRHGPFFLARCDRVYEVREIGGRRRMVQAAGPRKSFGREYPVQRPATVPKVAAL